MDVRYTLFPPLVVTKATTTTTTTTTTVAPLEVSRHPTWNTEEGWSIALLVLTTVRLALTLCLWTYLTYGTIRARTRLAVVWPHQLLLLVLTLSHGILYAFAMSPTPVVCGVLRLCHGLVYVVMFGVIVLKLIVIAANDKGYEVPRVGQILLLLLVSGVQLGLGIQWVILVPPEVVGQGPSRSCNASVSEWLGHLSYVGILLLAAIFLALAIHDVKADRRESLFLGLAVGLNVPLMTGFTLTAGLQPDDGGHVEKVLAFELLASTSVVLVVMFLPRSRQLSAMGETGLYTEDVAVVKPISELTVHKLYYPVYEDQQRRLSGTSSGAMRRTDFAFANEDMDDVVSRTNSPANEVDMVSSRPRSSSSSSHWYPPLRNTTLPVIGPGTSSIMSGPPSSVRHYQYSSPSHFDHYTGLRRIRLIGLQEPVSSSSRCLTPPSEEGSDATPSVQDGGDSDEAASEVDVANFHEHNVNGVSYTSVHVNPRQPVY